MGSVGKLILKIEARHAEAVIEDDILGRIVVKHLDRFINQNVLWKGIAPELKLAVMRIPGKRIESHVTPNRYNSLYRIQEASFINRP